MSAITTSIPMRGDVASAAAAIIEAGRRPTVREIAERLKPIGNTTVATAFRGWLRETLLALAGTAVELTVVEDVERRIALAFDGERVFLFVGEVMISSDVATLSEALSRQRVICAAPSEGGGIVVSLHDGGTCVRLSSDEYAFISGKIAACRALLNGGAQ
ncbi:hypothetical protein [Bosea sp. RAC05]|uniref:hypothetical protein n=1 Tax=Bosea sp. RAC05 TaxID=1842539 RepID=UPI00083CDC83|nr:hypothetical protein [Bosea sp. RAC05]AOG03410.1 hypothetical protein BSY19_4853 [Bosea sp. RAC05]